MAFNLGMFASGAGKGYLSYKELAQKQQEIEQRQQQIDIQKAADARAAEIAEREKTDWQQRYQVGQLLQQASTPTEGGVSTQDITAALPIGQRAGESQTTPEYRQAFQNAFSGLTPQQQAAVLQGYGSANTPGGKEVAAIPELKAAQLGTTTVRKGEDGQTYAVQPAGGQAMMDRFTQLAGASGNPLAIEKALEIQGKQQQLRIGGQTEEMNTYNLAAKQREKGFNEKFDKAMDEIQTKSAQRLTDINQTAQDGGMKGLVDKFGPDIKKALDHDIKFKNGAIIVLDAKGKPIGSPITNIDDAKAALEGAAKAEYANSLQKTLVEKGLFKSPEEAINYWKTEAELKNQGKTADAAMIKALSEQAKTPAEIDYYHAHADFMRNGGATANRPTMKTVQVETMDANGVKHKTPVTVVMKPTKGGAPEIATYDMDGRRINDPNVTKQAGLAMVEGTGLPQEGPSSGAIADLASARKRYETGQIDLPGYNAEVAKIRTGSAVDNALSNIKTLNPDADKTKTQPAAMPASSTNNTKYIRSKTPRGSWDYTPSPRGLSMDQWHTLDAKQSAIPQ